MLVIRTEYCMKYKFCRFYSIGMVRNTVRDIYQIRQPVRYSAYHWVSSCEIQCHEEKVISVKHVVVVVFSDETEREL